MRICSSFKTQVLWLAFFCFPSTVVSQSAPPIPELTATDPAIRALLNAPNASCRATNLDNLIENLNKAVNILGSRGLTGDRALVEAALGSALTGQGRLELASAAFQKALEDARVAKNEVLQADILVALASEAQVKGNIGESIELVSRALGISERTGSLYEKAHALGELGRLNLLAGRIADAGNLIDEALKIDKLNGYSFEAMHLVYQGYYLGAIGKESEATQAMAGARAKSISTLNAYAFVSAENAYAFGVARSGKADEAVGELQLVRAGELSSLVQDEKLRDCLTSDIRLPILHVIVLEGLTNVLRTAGKKEKEIEVWRELLSASRDMGFLAGQGEAEQKIADLENQLNKSDDSLRDYALAAGLYQSIQNYDLLNQVEISRAQLLVRIGRGLEAVPIENEIISYAHGRHARRVEISTYTILGDIYQTAGELPNARESFEKAIALIHPRPFDDEVSDEIIHEAYVRLSNIYRALKLPSREFVATDNAFFVSVHMKNEKNRQAEVAYLNQRINELQVRSLVEEMQKDSRLAESLTLSYILFIHDGFPSKPTDDKSNWQRIVTLPFQIVHQKDGASSLKGILTEIGPMVGFNKLPLLSALGRFYVTDGADPSLAIEYALQEKAVLEGAQGDLTTLKSEAACTLAIGYSRLGKRDLAKSEVEECTTLGKNSGDEQAARYSDAANLIVQTQLGNVSAAKSSLESLINRAPDNIELHVELAMALAAAAQYAAADSRVKFVIQKLESLGNKKEMATVYSRMAACLSSDPSSEAKTLQLRYLQLSRQQYHALGAKPEEAETIVALGDYYMNRSQTKLAIDSYQTALDLAEQVGTPGVLAESLLGLGNGYKANGQFVRAADYHHRASNKFHDISNPQAETLCFVDLANDYYEAGQTDLALDTLVRARNSAKDATTLSKYLVAYSFGDLYRARGFFEKAAGSYRDAIEITQAGDDFEHLGYSHLALAALNTIIGAWDDALGETQIALGLFQKIESKAGQGAAWATLASIYSDRNSSLKNFGKAQEYYAKAQALDPKGIRELELVEMYQQSGRYTEAAKIANESIEDCQRRHDNDCEASILVSLAEIKGLAGDLKDARAALSRAQLLGANSEETYFRGRLLYADARLLVLEGKLDDAFVSYRKLISLIETVKGNLSAQEQKSISENYGYIYDELVSLLYSIGEKRPINQRDQLASEALGYAEINKARQFAASWGRGFINQLRPMLPPATQDREDTLYARRDRLLAQMEAATNTTGPEQQAMQDRLTAELTSVRHDIQDFLKDLRKSSPQYASIAYPEQIDVSSVPLKKGETLVELKMTDDATFGWVIQNKEGDRNALTAFYKIPQKRAWFLEKISRLRMELNAGRPGEVDSKTLEAMYAELFPGEIGKLLLDSTDIIFVPDDALFILPFELFSPDASASHFVFLGKATTYYPSANALRLARNALHQTQWQEAFFGMADPIVPSSDDDRFLVASELKPPTTRAPNEPSPAPSENLSSDRLKARGFSFERIPGTAKEVQNIATLLTTHNERVEVRIGASATKSEMLDTDLSKFRFVHFATHGVSPVDTGIKEPFLVLSWDGPDLSRMRLSMSEIVGLKLHSESVVLSACNTGSGNISRAEGVMSLGRAFLAAGASSVTVSLWQVSDESTALLMGKYYEGLLAGKSKSQSLAEARQTVFAGGKRDPFFWAPFILIGE